MKKLLVVVLIALLTTGCEYEDESEKAKSRTEQTIGGFVKADYEKYNSSASQNGLEGSLIYIDGTVNSKISVENVLAMIVVDENNNSWLVSLTDRPEEDGYIADELTGHDVRVFGEYQGYSSVYNMPALAIAIEDGRIDFLKNDGEYETLFEFSEYYKSREQENISESEVLSKETYYIGEDEFSFSLFQESGEFKTSLFCNIENKSNVFDTYFFLNSFLNSKEKDVMTMADVLNLTYTIFAGDGSFIMQNKDMLYLSSSEKEIMSADDYFSQDWLTNEYQKGDYGTQIADFLVDFIENN